MGARKRSVALEVRAIDKQFGDLHVLKSIELTVGDAEFVSIIGPSGCGKSTLLDIVAGLTVPDRGQVVIAGEPTNGQRGHSAYMPQKDSLLPWRTIIDNVIIPLQIAGMKQKQARLEAKKWLPLFGLESFAFSYPHQLSGGMRQRAAFLRTCLSQKPLMLLDEPFGSLDALTRLDMQRWLMEMWQQFRTSVLLITHDIDEALLLSDRIYVFSPRPGTVIGEMKVEWERPRRRELSTTAAFAEMKAEIMRKLEQGQG